MPVVKRFRADGGSNTSPYDTWAKGSTAMATLIAAMADSDWIWLANDSVEAISADTTWTFPGTIVSPNRIVSVQKDTPPSVALAGFTINVASTKQLLFRGCYYMWGVTINLATTTGLANLGISSPAGGGSVFDTCVVNFVGTGNSAIAFGTGSSSTIFLKVKNITIKYSSATQVISISDPCLIDGLIIDPASSAAPTKLIAGISSAGGFDIIIQNCDLTAGAQGIVIFPATSSYAVKAWFKNSKLPANWNGTLVAGGAITSKHFEAEMINCDSGETNYRRQKYNYFGFLRDETALVATGGAYDGTTRLSWKIATTANANPVNPFDSGELAFWNDTEITQRTATVEIIHSAAALLTDADIWLELDYSANTGDPLYAKLTDRVADLFVTAAANQTASTTDWDDLVTARANNTAYVLGNLMKVASNPGRVFICTTAGNSAVAEPAGLAAAVDGGVVSEGGGLAGWTAMWRQTLSVTLPAAKPANKGWINGKIMVGKASTTVYVDAALRVV